MVNIPHENKSYELNEADSLPMMPASHFVYFHELISFTLFSLQQSQANPTLKVSCFPQICNTAT